MRSSPSTSVIVVYGHEYREGEFWDATVHDPACSYASEHLAVMSDEDTEDALTEFEGGTLVRQWLSRSEARARSNEQDWRVCLRCDSGVQEVPGRRDRHP